MLQEIESVMKWNEIAGNKGTFNRHLETSMLSEELAEAVIALKEKDSVELVDGILDVFWVGMWTLYKLGYTPEQVHACFKEIEASNYSKFVKNSQGNLEALKDETGKILKPESHFKPNLEQFVGDITM